MLHIFLKAYTFFNFKKSLPPIKNKRETVIQFTTYKIAIMIKFKINKASTIHRIVETSLPFPFTTLTIVKKIKPAAIPYEML